MKSTASLIVLLTCIVQTCLCLYSNKGDVQILTAKTFDKVVKESDQITIVEFFAPWCGHCKNLAPIYNKVATTLKGMVNVAAIDCDEESNKSVCGQYGIQGFPTIKVMKPRTNKKGGRTFSVEDYQGQRTVKAIAEHATSIMPSTVQKLTSESLDKFLQARNESAKVILFTKKGATSAIYKALSTSFGDRVMFAQIRDNQQEAVRVFGIQEFPALILLPGGTQSIILHTGEMKLDAMKTFVASNIASSTDSADSGPEQASMKKGEGSCPKKHGKNNAEKESAETSSERSPTLHLLSSKAEFVKECLKEGTKSSLLLPQGLVEQKSLSKYSEFAVYEFTPEVAGYLRAELKVANVQQAIFLNGKKGWYIEASSDMTSSTAALEFLDKVKQGEAGEKVKFVKDEARKTEL